MTYEYRELVREIRVFTYVNEFERDMELDLIHRLQMLGVSIDKSSFRRQVWTREVRFLGSLPDDQLIKHYAPGSNQTQSHFNSVLH